MPFFEFILATRTESIGILGWDGRVNQTQDGYTALMFAARNEHAECTRLLVESGADTGATDNVRCINSFLSLLFAYLPIFVRARLVMRSHVEVTVLDMIYLNRTSSSTLFYFALKTDVSFTAQYDCPRSCASRRLL